MTTYFVSNSGNDSFSGSQNSPFATITHALSVMVSGDTVFLRGGTYPEALRTFQITIPSGTSYTNAITISGFQQELASITGISTGILDFSTGAGKSYIIFRNLTLDCSFSNSQAEALYAGVTNHHIRFDNIDIKSNFSTVILLTTSTGNGLNGEADTVEFLNCRIHGWQRYGAYARGTNWLFDNCEVYDNGGYGIQVYNSGHNDVSGNIIRNCNIHDCALSPGLGGDSTGGILISSGSNNLAYNNIIYNLGSHSLYGIGFDYFNGGGGNAAYNNTVFNIPGDGISIGTGGAGAIVQNNISFNNSGQNIVSIATSATIDHNFTANPNFVDSTNGDFHLQSTSSAINFGRDLSSVFTVDKDGNTRTLPFDVGAYEFVSVILPPPPTTITCDDSLAWTLVSSGTFASNTLLKTINFSVRPARWIALRSIREINGNPWTSCTEFMALMNGRSLLQTKGIFLEWEHALITDPPTDPAVAFRIYRQDTPTGLFTLIATVPYPIISYLDTNVIPGNTYSYETTSIDYFGNESSISNIASGVAPSTLQHSIWCVDSQELGVNNGAVNAIDGLTTTFWHTQWMTASPPQPHNIVVDLGTVYPLNGFQYLPRQDGNTNGTIIQYEFYICDYFISKGRGMHTPVMQPMLAM